MGSLISRALLRLAFGSALLTMGVVTAAAQITPIPGNPGTVPPPLPPAPLSGSAPQGSPGTPPKLDTFQDKAVRCQHYGTSVGVQPGDIGQYTRECANSQ